MQVRCSSLEINRSLGRFEIANSSYLQFLCSDAYTFLFNLATCNLFMLICYDAFCNWWAQDIKQFLGKGKEMFYLMMHVTHFIYSNIVKYNIKKANFY